MPFKQWQRRIGETLDLPEDLFSGGPRITLVGFAVIMIEDFRRIISFSDERVIVTVGSGHVELWGKGLVLAELSPHEIEIKGEIHGLKLREEETCTKG
ncbi:MAG: YabP/YqfC family sporulation protein [Gracilibacteraceae bacterium]|nr:YabP/YqfC family sporulation protein [Gracilibacteraceae bacterium]